MQNSALSNKGSFLSKLNTIKQHSLRNNHDQCNSGSCHTIRTGSSPRIRRKWSRSRTQSSGTTQLREHQLMSLPTTQVSPPTPAQGAPAYVATYYTGPPSCTSSGSTSLFCYLPHRAAPDSTRKSGKGAKSQGHARRTKDSRTGLP